MSQFLVDYALLLRDDGGPTRYKAALMDDKRDRLLSVFVEVDGYAEIDPKVPERIEAIQGYHSYDLNDPKEVKAMREDMKELKRWHRQMANAIAHMEKAVLPNLRAYAKANLNKE